eukprot:741543-Rhodomonas_salina.1
MACGRGIWGMWSRGDESDRGRSDWGVRDIGTDVTGRCMARFERPRLGSSSCCSWSWPSSTVSSDQAAPPARLFE